jgi:hypothetical protein
MALLLSLSLFTTGCLKPIAQRSTAVAAATAPVVDQAAAAYRSANSLHDLRIDYDAVAEFDAPAPVYNPRNIQPLMSGKDINTRLAVLAAFQEYVKSVAAITSGTDSPELQAASKSAGQSLTTFGNTLAPAIESAFGIAAASAAIPASTTETTVTTASGNTITTTSSTASKPATPGAPVDPITPTIQNGISTAIDALSQFLINRKTKKELPPVILSMDSHVKVLCDLLESDIAILKDQQTRDYNFIINRQTLFIRTSRTLDAEQRREQIMKLPEIVRQQRVADQQLTQLSAAIARLELAHHALAVEAQGNNPESLTNKLGDLEAAGNDLGKFYSSLPTK